ncbi:restriction endonuclease subunit S [Lactococcus lactis]|uniref:Restriction endonuclease subunit S n=1 Tax=Lactococcus lactis TaxID=1358 RepID=A0AAP3Z1V4_9LACT|nr:restriction endonuclease subunit S [Lactococcus lactis]MDG4969563.1 restriction endonuclease subunit S [Lactococcus lactis]MDG4976799.1 restriction endonuclease subunit S [Lactococcus lactis]MDG5103531.1 restriction endonuclease subunit S [Lactococcus lactis]
MSENKKLIPKRRFKEFENADAWEQRELDILADFSKGSGYSKSDLVSTGEPVILYGRLYTNYETVIRDIDTFVNDISNSVLSKGGEVIVPSSGETAEDISRASVVDSTGIALGGDLNIIYPKAQIDSTFLALTISNGNQKKELSKRAQGKSVVHIRNEDLKKVLLVFPKKEEQKLIGRFFCSLDQTIAFQQRKLEKMKSMKSAYLSEMFPAEGERKPKRRFPGFTDDWEQRELGEVADVRDGTHDSPKFVDNGYPLVTSKNLTSGTLDLTDVSYLTQEDYDAINQRSRVDKGDILFAMIGTIGNPVIVENTGFAIKNVALIKEDKVPNKFLLQLLKSSVFEKYIKFENAGGTQKFLGLGTIRNFKFLSPSKEEAIQIADFFSNLDQTIAFQQQKLEKLQNIKKAYLNEMFI